MFVVLCTAPVEVAPALARGWVEAGVAACVNLVPGVRSIYAWQGAVCDDAETLLICKTARAEALADAIRADHPYDTPEIVVLTLDDARTDARYLAWVVQQSSEEVR